MKKIVVLLLLILLSGCLFNKYYAVTFDDVTITVGKDDTSVLNDKVDSYEASSDSKGNEYLSKIVVYLDDLDNKEVKIDNYIISKGIKDSCSDLNGEYIENNGEACLITKTIRGKANSITLYGDLLSDDIDEVNRIEVAYK